MKTLLKFVPAILALSVSSAIFASDQGDLDDIKNMDKVSIETCLDAALDTIPGDTRKVEFKMEDTIPVYEFDIDGEDGMNYNVECNAQTGFIHEIEREVEANDSVFKKYAKISESEARKIALDFHPGTVVSNEMEVGFDGGVTYEYDIQTKAGFEVKVDIDAITGEVEEANIELYEIGMEKE